MKRAWKIILAAVLVTVAALSAGKAYCELKEAKDSDDSFAALQEMVSSTEESTQTSSQGDVAGAEKRLPEQWTEAVTESTPDEAQIPQPSPEELFLEKYRALKEENPDFIGWIRVEGTHIDYPVMQSVDEPNFYLKHGFDQKNNSYGVPYLDEACVLGVSNNLVIYGHHMKNGSMFCDLDGYKSIEFRNEHPVIYFDSAQGFCSYEVVAVFTYNTNKEHFRYDYYTAMDEAAFAEFKDNVTARQLYATGLEWDFGDEFLTLSTCEYTYNNGRLVVVARKCSEGGGIVEQD